MKQNYIILSVFGVTTLGVIIYLIDKKNKKTKNTNRTKDDVNSSIAYIPNWDKPFNLEFANEVKRHLAPQKISEIAPGKAAELAMILLKADGKPEKQLIAGVKSTIGAINDKVELSGLSNVFYRLTKGKDLYRYLDSLLSDHQMETLISKPVNQLSKYTLL